MAKFLFYFPIFALPKAKMPMKLIIITILSAIALVALAVIALGVKVFFVKGGKFPSGHIHDSDAMRSRGIRCAHCDDTSDRS